MIRKQHRHCISSAFLCGVGLAILPMACSSSSQDAAEDTGGEEPGGEAPTDGDGDTSGMEQAMDDEQMPPGDGAGSGVTPTEGQNPDMIVDQDPDPPVTSTPPNGSAGCSQSAMPVSGARTLDMEGQARTYVLDVPADYDGARAYPIVFGFHGATTSGEFFRSRFYGNLLSAMGEEAIVVHPDALGDPTQWGNGDVPFFDALLAALAAELCIDQERVFATGHSSGGFFTNTLGCQRGDVLRAIAPVSGGGPFNFGGNACTGEVAAWIAHGENDETVLFERGVESRDRWLAANGCGDTTAAVSPEPCEEYSGCREGLPVRFCVYQDGHNWPDFAPEGIWEFFSSL